MKTEEKIIRILTMEFNKYRFPECEAKIIKIDEEYIKVEFTGTTASFSCCFDEHFEDYREMLEEREIKTKIENVKRKEIGKFVVTFRKIM